MMPNIRKGSDMRKLLQYLVGPGRANEHRNQRVLAGDVVTMSVYAGRISTPQANELAALLDSPRQTLLRGAPVLATDRAKARRLMAEGMDRAAAFAAAASDHNVWHCPLTLDPAEGQLDDAKWRAIAEDFMREMGFTGRADVPDVRWAAIHHGPNKGGGDHIHLAVAVVRPDGSLIDTYRDYLRAQAAANKLEHKYGLAVLASREEGGTEQATKPGERARAERVGAPETDREALRRRVRGIAVSATSEAEWVREVRVTGLMIRPYFAKGGRDEVTGYAVALRPQRGRDGKLEKQIAYGGGRLARDLTLSALREWAPWDRSAEAREQALVEWRKTGAAAGRGTPIDSPSIDEQQAVEALRQFSARAAAIPVEDRSAWAATASQSSGLFAALSVRAEVKPGPLDRLSRQLARAGELPAHQRVPRAASDHGLRDVSRMLWATTSPQTANAALVYAMVECLLAVQAMLAATDRARASMAMASEARKALTEIHMRSAGIDPAKPYVRDEGSPAWAAAVRASVVVERGNPADVEPVIAAAHDAWNARRRGMVATGQATYDERGQILTPTQAPARKPLPGVDSQTPSTGRPRPGREQGRGFDR